MSDDREALPRIARYKPYYFKPVPGKTYLWCSCGRSSKQPFCDGSHKGTQFQPVEYVATESDGEVLLCGCKHSKSQPFCDGSHNNLLTTYEVDDPQSDTNQNKIYVAHHRSGRFELNGSCYVARIDELSSNSTGNVSWSCAVTDATGAKFQAMFFLEVGSGLTPVISFGESEVVLFLGGGRGEIVISGKTFALHANCGVYIRRGEAFQIDNHGHTTMAIYASVCPQTTAPSFDARMTSNFDASAPERIVALDPKKLQRMADRSFQLLVSKEIGSQVVTQFIGTIPYSKAAPHRHLYEEALIVLSGHGMIWTEDLKTKVRPGDIIFLPSKQAHSLQCTDPQGMQIVGVIYPGGNPDINF
jgi:CDGSH-type Zn-finger protein/mannose-6-phosphate isomerase-like protein (cupin superfamily)